MGGGWAGKRFLRAAGRRPGKKSPLDTAGAGKRFTIQMRCAKFVEDNSTFDAAGIGKDKRRYVMGAKVTKYRDRKIVINSKGKKKEKIVEKSWAVERTSEPDFIKLYPEAWTPKKKTLAKDEDVSTAGKKTAPARGKNAAVEEDTAHLTLPAAYRFLFFVLAARMGYCDSDDLAHSQLVMTGEPYREEIMEIMGWTNRDSLMKGLRALCECNIIRKVSRGCYQINPRFASKGQWLYNPRIPQSNVEGLKKYYDDEQREARRKKEKEEKKKKKEARENRQKNLGLKKTGGGKELPVAETDTEDIPPAVKETVTPPPEIPDNTEPDDRYDDGGFTDNCGPFHT